MSPLGRFSCLLLLALLGATSASASPPDAYFDPGPVLGRLEFGAPASADSSGCTLGWTGPSTGAVRVSWDHDAYFTLLDPWACNRCEGGGFVPKRAHYLVHFTSRCAFELQIGIVGAGGDYSCMMPFPETPLMPVANFRVVPPGLGVYELSFDFPSPACIRGPAFLKWEIVDHDGCADSWGPGLLTGPGCIPCLSWEFYPGALEPEQPCSSQYSGNPIMWVDTECCAAVPTLPKSWGSLKTLYR